MIASRANSRIRNLAVLRKKHSERFRQDVFLVEGIKMFREIPAEDLQEVYASESFAKSEAGRAAASRKRKETEKSGKYIPFEIVSDEVFRSLSDTQSPQGVLAVVRQRHYEFENLLGKEEGRALILALENLQDPGNLGTIFRTAEAAGATGILMSRGTADLTNPKVIRSTMGSIFRMPYLYTEKLTEEIARLRKRGITVCAAYLDSSVIYDSVDYTKGTAFLIGNESRGLCASTASLADMSVRIPMEGKTESLNASAASAVLLYEANRQRRHARVIS